MVAIIHEGRHRCDARCYNAKGGVCECCCGGVNHGRGLAAALENARAVVAPEEMQDIIRRAKRGAGRDYAFEARRQPTLF